MSYRSPTLALDHGEAELPSTALWRAVNWPVSQVLRAWVIALRYGGRVETEGARLSRPAVYVTWHRTAPLLFAHLPPRIPSLIALAGTAPHVRPIRRAGRLVGLGMVPASSDDGGGHALAELAGEIASGASVVVTPDAPRGPAFRAKPGCVRLARLAGVPLVPVALGARGVVNPWSWDRMLLPWPVNRFVVRFGAPFLAADDEETALRDVERHLGAVYAAIGQPG